MEFIQKLITVIDIAISSIQKFSTSKYSYFYATIIYSTLSIILCFPKYDILDRKIDEVIAQGVSQQFTKPFAPINYEIIKNKEQHPGHVSHLDKRAFRITVPLIGYILGFHLQGGIILQHITTFLLIFLLMHYFKSNADATTGLLIGLFFTGLTTVQWGFFDFYYYDGIAWFFIFASLINPIKLVNPLLLILAYFTDERALICSSMLVVFYLYQLPRQKITNIILLILSWFAYFTIRLFLAHTFGLSTGKSLIGGEILTINMHMLPLGLISAYETGLCVIAVALLTLLLKKEYLKVSAFIFSFAMIIGSSVLVQDSTRSMAYGFIGVVFCLLVIIKENTQSIKSVNRFIFLLAVLNLLFPHYSFIANKPTLQPSIIRIIIQ